MKLTKSICLLVTVLLSVGSYQVMAQATDQDKGKGGSRQQDRERQIDRDMARDQTRDREQDRSRDQDRARDQDRDRDRLHDGIGGIIYASELMTEQERNRYRQQLKTATSEQQRNEIRLQHQNEMHSRARDRAEYQDGMGGIIYGAGRMTEQERNRYREQLKTATSEQQRNEIRMQHQKDMQLRDKMNNN